jgi:hypothetical protein
MSLSVNLKQSSLSFPQLSHISRPLIGALTIFAGSMLLFSQFHTTQPSFNFANVSVSVLAAVAGGSFLKKRFAQSAPAPKDQNITNANSAIEAKANSGVVEDKTNTPVAEPRANLAVVETKTNASVVETKTNASVVVKKANLAKEPTTSGYLRFISIWLHADKHGLTQDKRSIAIFGPGMLKDNQNVHCPQLIETCQMFPGSHISVYDSNHEVLDAIGKLDHSLGVKKIKDTFSSGNNKLLVKADNIEKIKNQLESDPQLNCPIALKEFRMGENSLDGESGKDVIIATFSLYYPMLELSKTDPTGEKRLNLLGSFLAKLNSGGAMYIEKDCIAALFGNKDEIDKAFKGDPAAQKKLKDFISGNTWIIPLKNQLKEQGINVSIATLRQSFGINASLFQGVYQAGNARLTQTSDVVVFIKPS